ncbi:hypothetical protein [Methylomarinum vadi]|uniref:hypothetical protein n=1 Tax=Methylomarinum vadi TaxID=438855 RepID=UPI001F214BF5|nr:hypothetical protein [Methylomarinum vadi]
MQNISGKISEAIVSIYALIADIAEQNNYVDRLSAIRAVDDESIGYDLATANKKGL